jgi:septum formation inhibitor MinC
MVMVKGFKPGFGLSALHVTNFEKLTTVVQERRYKLKVECAVPDLDLAVLSVSELKVNLPQVELKLLENELRKPKLEADGQEEAEESVPRTFTSSQTAASRSRARASASSRTVKSDSQLKESHAVFSVFTPALMAHFRSKNVLEPLPPHNHHHPHNHSQH